MSKIDDYIEGLYAGISNDDKEAHESKEEMRQHLNEEVAELIKNGLSEDESANVAISKFGDVVEVRKEIKRMFRTQARFAKKVLIAAFVFLLIGVVSFAQYISFERGLTNRYYLVEEGKEGEVAVKIHDLLYSKSEVTQSDKDEIKRIVDDFNKDNGLGIWRVDVSDNHANIVYHYETPNISEKDTSSVRGFDIRQPSKSPDWHVNYGTTRLYIEKLDEWRSQTANSIDIRFVLGDLSYVFVGMYWILFGIWFVIRSYHNKSLSVIGVLLVILFNLIGWLIYRFILKIKLLSLKSA